MLLGCYNRLCADEASCVRLCRGLLTVSLMIFDTVGFALETENETANAEKKIVTKNFDLIVLNSLNDNGAGFGVDTNQVTLINKKKEATKFTLKSKKEVARDIVNAIIENSHA